MEEEFRPLTIGFMGLNSRITDYGIKRFIADNQDKIAFCNRRLIMLKDGTTIVPLYTTENQRGRKFDQLVLFDDYRWRVKEDRRDDIDYVINCCLSHSCVPEEFQVLEYEEEIDWVEHTT